MDAWDLRLRRCNAAECHALCCYDGVYLLEGEELLLREVLRRYPEWFVGIPEPRIESVAGQDGIPWLKTTKVPHDYPAGVLPAHFTPTRCVFAQADHRCRLQTLAEHLGLHPWAFKPTACWMCPVKADDGEIVLPPMPGEPDPDYEDAEHPGYTSFLPCGRHDPKGDPWYEVLDGELAFYEMAEHLPVWDLRRQSFEEILAEARDLRPIPEETP